METWTDFFVSFLKLFAVPMAFYQLLPDTTRKSIDNYIKGFVYSTALRDTFIVTLSILFVSTIIYFFLIQWIYWFIAALIFGIIRSLMDYEENKTYLKSTALVLLIAAVVSLMVDGSSIQKCMTPYEGFQYIIQGTRLDFLNLSHQPNLGQYAQQSVTQSIIMGYSLEEDHGIR